MTDNSQTFTSARSTFQTDGIVGGGPIYEVEFPSQSVVSGDNAEVSNGSSVLTANGSGFNPNGVSVGMEVAVEGGTTTPYEVMRTLFSLD